MRMRQKTKFSSGYTLVELSVALGVGSIVGLILLGALVQGTWLFRSNESEMWARDSGSKTIRTIRDDIRMAQSERIYADYTKVGGTETNNGSCAIIVLPDARGAVTYYRWPATGSGANSGLYYHANGATTPNPTTDTLLVNNVMDFEFRRNPNGTVRIGFVLGSLGYPRRLLGGVESDRVRFSTSAIPRNP
ncbi:MAG: PilW family protein [Chthoniobacterales bacterium]